MDFDPDASFFFLEIFDFFAELLELLASDGDEVDVTFDRFYKV